MNFSIKDRIIFLGLAFAVASIVTILMNALIGLHGFLTSIPANPPDTFIGAFLGAHLVFTFSTPHPLLLKFLGRGDNTQDPPNSGDEDSV